MKLKSKSRDGAKVKKEYEMQMTPYQRILNSKHVAIEAKNSLTAKHQSLNPFALKAAIK